MPPKKKKAKKEQETDSAEDFISKSKKALIQKLKKQTRHLDREDDYHRLVDSVRALIVTNNEIWQRCQPNKYESESPLNPGMVHLYRVGYLAVQVASVRGVAYFTTSPELEAKEFLAIPEIPQILQEHFPCAQEDTLQNHEPLLTKAVCLEEEIAKLFLQIFKEHLKAVQIALGEMDAWLLEPSQALSFINEQFQENIPVPELGNGCQDTCCIAHEPSSMCLKCFQPFSNHQSTSYNYGYGHDNGRHKCCYAPTPSKGVTRGSYMTPQSNAIKTVRMLAADEVKMTFNISLESEQERLKRFIHFVDPVES